MFDILVALLVTVTVTAAGPASNNILIIARTEHWLPPLSYIWGDTRVPQFLHRYFFRQMFS